MSHPLEDQSPHLYNIANGSFAPPESQINVAESVSIGKKIVSEFRASLPSGFHATILSPLKTMENLKKGVKVGDKTIFNLETIFLRLLTIGQQGEMELAHIFSMGCAPYLLLSSTSIAACEKGARHHWLTNSVYRQRDHVHLISP